MRVGQDLKRDTITDSIGKINGVCENLRDLPVSDDIQVYLRSALNSLDEAEGQLSEARLELGPKFPLACPVCANTRLRLEEWVATYSYFTFDAQHDPEYDGAVDRENDGYAYAIHCDECDYHFSDEELQIVVNETGLTEFTRIGYPEFVDSAIKRGVK